MDDRTIDAHPSYATISIRRYTGGPGTLFASTVKHQNTIGIVISRAELHRSLNTDWIHAKEQLIEVIMSPVQFAELLTTTMGTGAPCTIRHIDKQKPPPPPPFVDKEHQVRDEFSKKMRDLSKKFDDLTATLEEAKTSKTVSKATLGEIAGKVAHLEQEIRSNIPFITECFSETVENTKTEAKAAIDAHLTNRMMQVAQDGFRLVENLSHPQVEGPIVEI